MECSTVSLAGPNLEFFLHKDSEEYYIAWRIIKFWFDFCPAPIDSNFT